MRIGLSFLSFGKDIFAGIEASLYNLCLGLIENAASVQVYSGLLSGDSTELDGISIYRSQLLPRALPDGDTSVRQVLHDYSEAIRDELAAFCQNLDWLFVCDPLWGIVLLTEGWRKIDCPMLLSLRVPNTTDLLIAAQRAPFHLYTAVSHSLRMEVRRAVPLHPFAVLPNSVDIHKFRPGLADAPGNVVFCNARMSPEKGILDLVRCFPAVRRAVPTAELWLCNGSSPFGTTALYRHEVVRTIAAFGLDKHVRLLPQLRWDDIPLLISQARVVVLPSHRETFGRAALESMACGRPLVTTRAGNLPWLVDAAGLVVTVGAPQELATAIIAILQNDELGDELGTLGVQRASEFSNRRVAATLLTLLGSPTEDDQ